MSPETGTPIALPAPIKITTGQEGLYAIDFKQLAALGLDLAQAGSPDLTLTNLGQPRPFWVGRELKRLYFYAETSKNRYSQENVYLLSPVSQPEATSSPSQVVSAAETVQLPTLDSLPAGAFAARFHVEDNLVYNPMAELGDHWLWAIVPATHQQLVDVELKHILPGAAKLSILVWGSTESPVSPDHHLIVRVNRKQAADVSWDGKGTHLIEAELPPGLLQEGRNTVELDLPGDTGAVADTLYLDWLEIVAPRRFQAEADRLYFVSPGGELNLEGFTQPVMLADVTDPGAAQLVDDGLGTHSSSAGSIIFKSQAGRAYWAAGANGFLAPTRVELLQDSPDLRSADNAADYLAVGPTDLLDTLQPLIEWRAQQGMRTMALPAQAVYDQFGFGVPDPQAVRTFLEYAQQNWKGMPKYLLLVGDASYDPKGYQSPPEANRLPTFFVQTYHGGETASDYGFSLPSAQPWPAINEPETGQPQINVGRLPARTPAQVSEYVHKVLNYEKTAAQFDPQAPWQKHVFVIADGQEATFRTDADNFVAVIPEDYRVDVLAPEKGATDAPQAIKTRLDQGEWLVIYFGHGSINMWGKDKIFTRQDIASLENKDRLPIVLNLTCLTGLFTHPKMESLAEGFLWEPKGGAVAVLAPTSLTLAEDQSYLSYAIARQLFGDPQARLGDVFAAAQKRVLAENPAAQDVLRTFLLFGDPALRVARFPVP